MDFSPLSWKALHYATAFARKFDAEILMLHTVMVLAPGPEFQVASSLGNASLHEDAVKTMAEWRKVITLQASVKTRVLDGVPEHEIVRVAQENHIDLIIIGTHGGSGFLNHFLGGTTKRVVRAARCPVLVVREHEHEFLADAVKSNSHFRRSRSSKRGNMTTTTKKLQKIEL